ncbi:hypothetical protein CHS0354_018206 [Potamilus streckersoni]|uniref:Uncharacterized protein n=1 Tax=Potamilus streckersoni TaxID=2493646 RepID=A0AAE0RUH3_9BIVA|nr:hypothetical protein CHS0354_018206 [Potamilus streckersoni]
MRTRRTAGNLIVLILLLSATSIKAQGSCPTGDCITYDISTQAICTEVSSKPPTRDCRWPAGLNLNVDQVILGVRIVAYKIQWFSGGWSALKRTLFISFKTIDKICI